MEAVDSFLKKIASKSIWEGTDLLVKVFLKRHPEYETKTTGEGLDKFASNKELGMRHLARIPTSLYDLIDYFYHDDIESMGRKKFLYGFVKRYPLFKVPERI